MRSESHRVIRVIGTRSVPRRRHRRSEQPTLEPTILCSREMSHDPGDREISRRQHTSGRLIPWSVHQHSRRSRPVLTESLDQRRPFVCRLEVWVHDRPAVHASSLASQRNRCVTYRRFGDGIMRRSTWAAVGHEAMRVERESACRYVAPVPRHGGIHLPEGATDVSH